MRTILKCNRFTWIEYMLDTLKWLNVKYRLQLSTIAFIQKMKMGCAPEYVTEQLRYVGEVEPYNLRNALDFTPSRADINVLQNGLYSVRD